MRLVVFIALRQLWERKLLNGIAVLGVTLGVLVLIAMSGIMQGFQVKFTQSILKISPHVTLYDTELRRDAPMLALGAWPFPPERRPDERQPEPGDPPRSRSWRSRYAPPGSAEEGCREVDARSSALPSRGR